MPITNPIALDMSIFALHLFCRPSGLRLVFKVAQPIISPNQNGAPTLALRWSPLSLVLIESDIAYSYYS